MAESILGLIASAVVACTPTTTLDAGGVGTAAKRACFNADRAQTFSPLHERFVYVRAASDEHYLVTLDAVYLGLPYATGITITGTFRRVCTDTGATLRFLESGRPVSARIVRVEAVASREEAEELVKARTTPRPKG